MENISFWCKECNIDVIVPAVTRTPNKQIGKIKEGNCPKCKSILRRYPDKIELDKYFTRSRKVKIDKRVMNKDLLQINDPLFDIYYPEHKRKQNEQAERKAKEEWENSGNTHHVL